MDVTFLVHDLQIDFTVDNEVNVLAIFLEAENLVALLVDHFLHVVLNTDKEFSVVRVKVIDLLQKFYFELNPFVIVKECVLFNVMECIRTVGPKLNEIVFS